MTIEQMNVVIAEYAGLRFHSNGTVSQYPTIMKLDMGVTTANELTFHTDWNAVHFVWQKLRGELVAIENLENNKDEYDIWLDKAMLFGKSRAYTQLIEKAIAQDTDLPTAHKLIHEAITLIKK